LGFDVAGVSRPSLNSCKEFGRAVNSRRSVAAWPSRGRRVAVVASLASLLGLLGAPAGVLADTTVPSPPPLASPASTPAPPAARLAPLKQTLQNRQAQALLIGDLTASEAHALMLEKSLNQSELSLIALGQKILDGQNQVAQLDSQINAVTALHDEVSARLTSDRAQLADVLRRLYKRQDNFFVSLVRAGGFGGLLETIGYTDVVVDRERNLLRSVQADDVALAHAQTTLERSRNSQKETVARLVVFRTTLAEEIANEQSLQTQLQSTIDEGLAALDAMQTDSPEMAARRAALLKMKTESLLSQIEQAVFAQQNFQQTAQLIAEDPVLTATGRLLWPIPHATISQGFGPTSYVLEAAYAGYPHFHTGVDLSVPLGTPVFAAADGVVALARPMADASGALVGYGNYVVVQHDAGLKTLYAHLLSIVVKEGEIVHRGQLVGLVGSTGNSTGPHTHFEVRIENSPVDPMQMLPDLAPQPAAPIPGASH
jgi:murein DD-endopeptidase MepM/ murein hydrolase activator NlpD